VRSFDPDAVRRIKAEAPRDLTVGGPGLAAAALRAGLVDSVELFLVPVVVGGGLPALPEGLRLELGLVEARTFGNGTVWVRYDVRG
jgi:riboflavin biosynthesis pyrimidine reductase